jgi:hypothetical protein
VLDGLWTTPSGRVKPGDAREEVAAQEVSVKIG